MKLFLLILGWLFSAFFLLANERGLIANLATTQTAKQIEFNFPKDNNPKREWTLIVYMAGDNNLEHFALKDINEMEQSIKEGVDVVVLIDRAKGFDSSDGNWTGARVYKITKDKDPSKINSKLLAKLGEIDMGDGEVLREFLKASIKAFPAKHYGVIMWNHGGGWAYNSEDDDISNKALGVDFLTLDELSLAISQALKSSKVDKLDIIGFDMCLMSEIEVANQIKSVAKVMIASQANEPGDGWPYTQILPEFAKGTKGARGVGSAIVEKYNLFYSKRGESIYTLSALDLSLVDDVIASFNKIVDRLSDSVESKWSLMAKSIFFSENYQSRVKDLKRGKNAVASVDMVDSIKNLSKSKNFKDLNLEKEYNHFVDVMDRFILSSANSPSKSRSNGVSIYAPVIENNYNPNYQNILFSKNSNWSRFLNNLYSIQQKKATTANILDIRAYEFNVKNHHPIKPILKPMTTNGFKYKVEGKGILWIQGLYGAKTKDGGVDILKVGTLLNSGGALKQKRAKTNNKFESSIPDYKDGLNEGNLYFDGLLYVVLGGGKYYYATVLSPIDSEYFIVPIRYKSKKFGEYEGNIYFDTQTWAHKAVEIFIPLKDGKVSTQFIKPEPDDVVTLEFLHISKDGKDSYICGSSFKWGDGPELALSYFQKGDYVVGLSVKSLNGTSKYSFSDFKVEENSILENAIKQQRGVKFKNSDFLGDWVYIDADKFLQGGQIVPLNKKFRLIIDKKAPGLLFCGVSKDNFKNFDELYYILRDFRIFPHFRYFRVKKFKKDSSEDDFKIVFTMPFWIKDQLLLLQMDTLTFDLSLAIKLDKKPKQNSTKPPQNQNFNQSSQNQSSTTPAQNSTSYQNKPDRVSIVGVWQSPDEIVKFFENGTYEIFQQGKLIGSGYYKIKKDTIYFQTSQKKLFTLKFSLSANQLTLMAMNGETFIYKRVNGSYSQTQNSQTQNYNNQTQKPSLDGVWQIPGVAILIISGNSYRLYEKDVLTDRGVFQIQGNSLVSKSLITGQIYQYKYRLNGNRFELIDMQGNRYIYFNNQ